MNDVKDLTVRDVVDSMTENQKQYLYKLVGEVCDFKVLPKNIAVDLAFNEIQRKAVWIILNDILERVVFSS